MLLHQLPEVYTTTIMLARAMTLLLSVIRYPGLVSAFLHSAVDSKADAVIDIFESKTLLRKRPLPYTSVQIPSLYLVYLLYRTQHHLLLKVQGILENTYYNFGRREIKSIIKKEGWD